MNEITSWVVTALLGLAALYLVWTQGMATTTPQPFWAGVAAVILLYAAHRTYDK